MKKQRSYAEGRIAGLTEAMRLVPHNWLDPMLSGPEALAASKRDNEAIEELLNAIRARIYAAAAAPKKRAAKRGRR